jgi:penicillin-binding protein 1A
MKNVTGGSLPAIAWHEFMVAAHQGVAQRALPGNYVHTAPVQPVALPARRCWQRAGCGRARQEAAAHGPGRQIPGAARGARRPDGIDQATVRRCRRSEVKRETSILDIIMGN